MRAEILSTSISKFWPTSIFELLGTLVVIALLLWFVWRRIKSAPPSSPSESESDKYARNLIDDMAREVSKKFNMSGAVLSQELQACRERKPLGNNPIANSIAPLRVECAVTKIAANRIGVRVQMLCQQNGQAVITSINRECFWDGLPREIRSEFIKTGQTELHYILCELVRDDQTKTNA